MYLIATLRVELLTNGSYRFQFHHSSGYESDRWYKPVMKMGRRTEPGKSNGQKDVMETRFISVDLPHRMSAEQADAFISTHERTREWHEKLAAFVAAGTTNANAELVAEREKNAKYEEEIAALRAQLAQRNDSATEKTADDIELERLIAEEQAAETV